MQGHCHVPNSGELWHITDIQKFFVFNDVAKYNKNKNSFFIDIERHLNMHPGNS
jgi:hypothetical protein